MDYRKYIPSAKSISIWVIILSMCAISMLFLCSSCKSVQRTVEVHDTLIVTHNDTVVTEKVVKDSSAIREFQSVIERLERDASDIRTIVLSDKGDTIKDYREKVIIKSESRDSVAVSEMMRKMEESLSIYKARAEALYKAMKESSVEKPQPSFASRVGGYVLAFFIGIIATIVALLVYILKHK